VVNGIVHPSACASFEIKILRIFDLKIRMESADSTTRGVLEPNRFKAVNGGIFWVE
jgi:hypothetical protein